MVDFIIDIDNLHAGKVLLLNGQQLQNHEVHPVNRHFSTILDVLSRWPLPESCRQKKAPAIAGASVYRDCRILQTVAIIDIRDYDWFSFKRICDALVR